MNIGIGVLCYSEQFIDRILNWTSKLDNRDRFSIVVYHDNTSFTRSTKEKLSEANILVVEGETNKGMFLARQYLMKKLNSLDIECFIMCDDDDLIVSNLYDIVKKYEKETYSCTYFFTDDIENKEIFDKVLNSDKIIAPKVNVLPSYFASNTLFNRKINLLFNNFILSHLDFIEDFFGSTRILAGEDEILIQLHSEFCRFLFGENPKKFSDKITEVCDMTRTKINRYESNDHQYSKTSNEVLEKYKEFWNKMELLQPKFKEYLRKNYKP